MRKVNITISILPHQMEKYKAAAKEIAYKSDRRISDYLGSYIERLHNEVMAKGWGDNDE